MSAISGRSFIAVAPIVVAAWLFLAAFNSGTASMSGATLMSQMRTENPTGMLDVNIGLMIIAMMLPLIVSPLRHVYDQSLTHQRWLSMFLFIVGYFTVWISTYVALVLALGKQLQSISVLVILAVGALLWQCSPAKQQCLNRCHLFPNLKALGLPAIVDATSFGLRHGVWCTGSCILAMLVVMCVPINVPAMVVISFWLFAERFERPAKPNWVFRVPKRLWRAAWAHAILAANHLPSASRHKLVIPQS